MSGFATGAWMSGTPLDVVESVDPMEVPRRVALVRPDTRPAVRRRDAHEGGLIQHGQQAGQCLKWVRHEEGPAEALAVVARDGRVRDGVGGSGQQLVGTCVAATRERKSASQDRKSVV